MSRTTTFADVGEALAELRLPSWDGDPIEVKTAYRRRMRETHPDTGGDISDHIRVQDAYAMVLAVIENGAQEQQQAPYAPPSFGGGDPETTRPDNPVMTAAGTPAARPAPSASRRRPQAIAAGRVHWRVVLVVAIAALVGIGYAALVGSVMVGPLAVYGLCWVLVGLWHAAGRPELPELRRWRR